MSRPRDRIPCVFNLQATSYLRVRVSQCTMRTRRWGRWLPWRILSVRRVIPLAPKLFPISSFLHATHLKCLVARASPESPKRLWEPDDEFLLHWCCSNRSVDSADWWEANRSALHRRIWDQDWPYDTERSRYSGCCDSGSPWRLGRSFECLQQRWDCLERRKTLVLRCRSMCWISCRHPEDKQEAIEPLPPTPIALLLRRITWSLAQFPDCRASKRRRTFRSVIRLSEYQFQHWRPHWRSSETNSLKYPASITSPRSWIHFLFVIVATMVEPFIRSHIPNDGERHRNETDDTDCPLSDTMSCFQHPTNHCDCVEILPEQHDWWVNY